MVGKLQFAIGFGAGYVCGARAGRARYEQIAALGRRLVHDPRVQATADKARQVVGVKAAEASAAATDRAAAAGTAVKQKATEATVAVKEKIQESSADDSRAATASDPSSRGTDASD
jgi:hypothetical protein